MMKILSKVNIVVKGAFCMTLVLGSFAGVSPDAMAQTYPTKPIRIVVPSPPASGMDIIARLIGAKLTEAFGQQIIVDNRGGASGRIGAEIVARATPDGHTLLVISGSQTIAEVMYKDLNYNLVRDFSPVCLLGTVPQVLAVNPSVPATSVKELVTLAKSRPGRLKYGSAGSGSNSHLSVEIFKFMTGTDILHVPYKGAAAGITGAMAGEVDMTCQAMTQLLPSIKGGKLRALGVTSSKRTPLFPSVPPISESVPGYEWFGFYGLLAPAKTPPAILSKLNAEVIKALNTPSMREQMAAIGNEPRGGSQNDFALFITDQLERMKEAVKHSGAKPED